MRRISEYVDPGRSPWHLLGTELRHWREKVLGLSMREVGKRAFCDDGDLSKWERGLTRPHADTVRRLDDIYGAGGRLVALHALAVEMERLRTLAKKGISTEEAATERRQLLRLAAVGAGIGALGISSESARQLIGTTLDNGFRSIPDWELACTDHLYALRTRPPAQVAADLVMDLFAVKRQLDLSSPTEVPDLYRVTASLSAVHANALTRLGDHGAAIRWWQTARQAADASGNLELRVLVRSEEAGHGLYGQRAPEAVLRLVQSAQQLLGTDKPSVDLMTTQAKALSILGRHDQARETLHTLLDVADKGVTPDPLGFWTPSQIHFAKSWVYAGMGDERQADAARQDVLGLTRDYQYQANVQLHDALCMVVNGAVDQGARRAASVIDHLDSAYRSRHIIETGRLVLRTVPLAQQERPAVAELRELLATRPPRFPDHSPDL
ncbi:helix-turn-helix transcriptional regulator [Thermopolyspora sp. NPDC052614]|uniref:helix-turn-helix domain-containing protein n=1 Tax=Thermopolyspora sp. NPDC052614 TaxID=3155682 RepID=UPI00344962D9